MKKVIENPAFDFDIMESFRQGKEEAFAAFFDYYFKLLCFFSGKMISNFDEATDLVMPVFLKLWVRRNNFETAANVKSFLYITTRNSCLNYLRHTQVKENFNQEYTYIQDIIDDSMTLAKMIQAELIKEIYNEIDHLPEKRKEVFKLSYLDGFKNEEIAELLHISIFTVKEHKGKALQSLRLHFNH